MRRINLRLLAVPVTIATAGSLLKRCIPHTGDRLNWPAISFVGSWIIDKEASGDAPLEPRLDAAKLR